MIHGCFNLRISLSCIIAMTLNYIFQVWFWDFFVEFYFSEFMQITYGPMIAPVPFHWPFHDSHVTIGTLSSSPSCHPLLTELTCCYVVPLCCPEYCGIQPGSNDIKWGGIDAFFKLETSKRPNPLLFETIGSVVLSSCSFRETVGWVLFFPTHALTGCYSFAWSNWANEIPNL